MAKLSLALLAATAKAHTALAQQTAIEVIMFISNEEKQRLNVLLDKARHEIVGLQSIVGNLQERINFLEGQTVKVKKVKKPKKPLTAAQKAKQRQYQKAYNERKKAKKLAEKGNTNVSA